MLFFCGEARAQNAVTVSHSRQEWVSLWQIRVQTLLNKGAIPIIDMESSYPNEDGPRYMEKTLRAMDEAGVALMVLDGEQAPKDERKGYRWGYAVHGAVNAHPDRFILATNGGVNNNWVKQKGGTKKDFIDQTELHARNGDYPIMGEYEFRHYMSNSQCKSGKKNRDVTVPLTSDNGHRLFRLAQETGLAFLIHLEPEDKQLQDLETMLTIYPGAKVIVCHFGQLRHPDRQKAFSPELVRRLLSDHPGLYYDLSTGHPGRVYPCSGVRDTVLWEDSQMGQTDHLKPEYRAILTDFSDRFVSGFDYGGSRGDWGNFVRKRAANIRLILKDLPEKAQHDIAYRNAWKLLTGETWK